MKILTVIGARPQFIKSSPLSLLIKNKYKSIQEIVIHTGQHFDKNMSEIFFNELSLSQPKYNLSISNLSHGAMTGRMIESIESIILEEAPDYVLVYGDTNSTLAAALAAAKVSTKIIHIEAGLRSFNMKMPEEINRVLVDRISDILFCPSEASRKNLNNENISAQSHVVGDIMRDSIDLYREKFNQSKILSILKAKTKEYHLATIHRAENTDDFNKLKDILSSLNEISKTERVVFPIHPRTKNKINQFSLGEYLENIEILQPLSFFDTHSLLKNCKSLLTDSGGMQKEAYYHGVPCVTLRDETEWTETIDSGMNILVGSNSPSIIDATMNISLPEAYDKDIYGDGQTAKKILDILCSQ